jgi:hypothetical protein
MLSIEQTSLTSESAVLSSKFLNQKLEQHANSLLAGLKKPNPTEDSHWIVFDLKGEVLAAGATPTRNERSEFLF